MAGNAFDEQSEFLRSEKDTRPYWETQHRALALPLIKSGYNDSVSYGVPGILGGSAWGTLDDILRGRPVAKGEVEAAAGEAAGAAMTGAFAAPRPKGSIGMAGREQPAPVRAYRGVSKGDEFGPRYPGDRDSVWASSSPDIASEFAFSGPVKPSPAVYPVEMRFANPLTIDAGGVVRDLDPWAVLARKKGHDGLVVENVLDTPDMRSYSQPQTVYAAVRPGTVYSATTGDLLFANPKQASAASSAEHIAKSAARDEVPGIRAYHGSPHDFDKFDLSKIGTGEGAQAYGHGLYFAENEGVAGSYRTALSRAHGGWKFDGKPLEKPEDFWSLQKQLEDVEGNWRLNKLVNEFYSLRRQGYSKDEAIKNRKDWHRSDPEMQAAIDEFAKRSDMTEVPGRLYEVNIKADPADFLDWDKPVSPDVWAKARQAIQSGPLPQELKATIPETAPDVPMSRAAGMLGLDFPATSKALADAGIPGIKYLDQGSRTAGDGSRNYVVFDDSIVKIIRKYGMAGLAAFLAASSGADQSNAFDGRRQ